MSHAAENPRSVGIVLFDRFELLDVFGPAEMFGLLASRFELSMLGPDSAPVRSAQGPKVLPDHAFSEARDYDVMLVPGGIGTRKEVANQGLLAWLADRSAEAEFVLSVCTGAALLARAGVLDDRRATSNKFALEWVVSQGPRVEWVKKARWVEDGKFWSSSGVTAGIDMTLALIEKLHGSQLADGIARGAEYDRHSDADWDPYADLYPFTRQ